MQTTTTTEIKPNGAGKKSAKQIALAAIEDAEAEIAKLEKQRDAAETARKAATSREAHHAALADRDWLDVQIEQTREKLASKRQALAELQAAEAEERRQRDHAELLELAEQIAEQKTLAIASLTAALDALDAMTARMKAFALRQQTSTAGFSEAHRRIDVACSEITAALGGRAVVRDIDQGNTAIVRVEAEAHVTDATLIRAGW